MSVLDGDASRGRLSLVLKFREKSKIPLNFNGRIVVLKSSFQAISTATM